MQATKQDPIRSVGKKSRQGGQTLVEFALVSLLFFVVLIGLVEFARALWTWNTIVQATRAGARFAVVETPVASDTTVKNYVVTLSWLFAECITCKIIF